MMWVGVVSVIHILMYLCEQINHWKGTFQFSWSVWWGGGEKWWKVKHTPECIICFTISSPHSFSHNFLPLSLPLLFSPPLSSIVTTTTFSTSVNVNILMSTWDITKLGSVTPLPHTYFSRPGCPPFHYIFLFFPLFLELVRFCDSYFSQSSSYSTSVSLNIALHPCLPFFFSTPFPPYPICQVSSIFVPLVVALALFTFLCWYQHPAPHFPTHTSL